MTQELIKHNIKMATKKETVMMNVEAAAATENEQLDGDDSGEGTFDYEMSVDKAAERDLLDSDIDEEDVYHDKEKLAQAKEDELLDSDIDEEDFNPDEEELDPDDEEADELDHDDKEVDQLDLDQLDLDDEKNDKSLTTDEQHLVDAVLDTTKSKAAKNGVTAAKCHPEEKAYHTLLVYPVTVEDLESPVIQSVIRLAYYWKVSFQARRERAKQGSLLLRFNDTNASKKKVRKRLSGLKLCEGIKPTVEHLTQYSDIDRIAVMEKALHSLTMLLENKATEESPVFVFVNNIPLDICVNMLHFLYPSANSIQLPVNSQSVLQGYAIMEFPNLNEAKSVVKNNWRYPAQIGGKYLSMSVIGHEGKTGKPESPEGKVEEKRADKRPTTSSKRSQKQSLSESKSISPKCLRVDDKRGSPPRRTSETTTRTLSDKEDGNDKFDVFIGNFGGRKVNKQLLKDCLVEEMTHKGICSPGDSPIDKVKVFSSFAFAVFSSQKVARQAIKVLNGMQFEGRRLDVKEGQNDTVAEEKTQRREEEPIADKSGEYHVRFGNVPNCRPTELRNFIKEEFLNRGLCEDNANPVKRLSFITNRNFQFAVFHHFADAKAAIEELKGASFKGSRLRTKAGELSKDDFDRNDKDSLNKYNEDQSDISDTELGMDVPVEESFADRRGRYHVCFGNVPTCRPSVLRHFLNNMFKSRGLSVNTGNAVKTVFSIGNLQVAAFGHSSDAKTAIEKLNGVIFEGSRLTTKVFSTAGSH